ncbi:MAG: DUF6541 family protein [Propionibacteriaceae bacterium]
MSWWLFGVAAFLAATIIMVPGWFVLSAWGFRGFVRDAFAPIVSLSCISVGAVLGGSIGKAWPIAVLGLTALLIAIGYYRRRNQPAMTPLTMSSQWRIATLIGSLLWTILFLRALPRPAAISQTFDDVFHLNAVRFIEQTGNASSFRLQYLTSAGTPPPFYPAAFHDVAALVAWPLGGNIAVAVNAWLLIIVALVWPLSLVGAVALLSQNLPRPLIWVTGLLSAGSCLLPWYLLNFGVLYPNLLGNVCIPAAVAALMLWLGLTPLPAPLTPPHAFGLGLLIAPGIAFSHPSTIPLLGLIAVVGLCERLLRQRTIWSLLSTFVAAIGIAVLWWKMRPERQNFEPPLSLSRAALRALCGITITGAFSISVLMLFALIGAVVELRNMRLTLTLSWIGLLGLSIIAMGYPGGRIRWLLTGVWYQDAFRMSTLAAPLTLILAILGMAWLIRHSAALCPWTMTSALVTGICVVVILCAPSLTEQRRLVRSQFTQTPSSALLTTDEQALLDRLPALVPADAVIAGNPITGTALAYALSNRTVLFPHMWTTDTPVRIAARERLNTVATDPSLCPLLRAEHVSYVLDFGQRSVLGQVHKQWTFPGLLLTESTPGFTLVEAHGEAKLYTITACN